MDIYQIPKIKNYKNNHFFLIAGPCVVESEELVFEVAKELACTCEELEIPFIFKSSYKKANRTSLHSFSGIGDIKALEILKKVSNELNIPVLTDVHNVEETFLAAKYVDVLQIPAFLCRQTELLIAAGQTGKFVNIKKGQFLSAESMSFAKEKVESTGNNQIMLTERGTTFGYNDLVVDFRNIPIMKRLEAITVLDCTHSVQRPNTAKGVTGGQPEMIETLAKAGIAVGVDGLFIETHPNPKLALSDGSNMLPLNIMKNLLSKLLFVNN